ncbi:AMP-dependent synthetase [Halioglobus japonicus]|uniref:AMP-dependent synthetase n=1 Tax=Halioglobus japonicus TaxID=930805 RepID=A0AAP8MH98_9GAMM|nr:class I adenylate-forming enzyme family protein [Halioglobus japonicus]AQA19552.1 AMP-dependent synthetase [Halioglobus japonicus]PLW87379.1 AMP-dependent synthetase [Halioglobus japonicus]GHD08781.1 fatty acid--CoA ligase [Halioglobus japonicus]
MYDVLQETIEELTADDQMFAISEAEVRGQTLKVWTHAPANLREFWLSTAGHDDKDYLVYNDERLTYTQAHEKVARIANWLRANGIKEGDRIAIAMRNYPEWMLSYWAIACVGAVSVGVNAWWVADELQYGLEDSNTKMLICDQERLDRLTPIRDALPDMQVVTVRCAETPAWAAPWETVVAAPAEMPDAQIDPDDDVCIFYTSGTTGRPKGAQLTHRSCANNIVSTIFGNLSQVTAVGKLRAAADPDAQPTPPPEQQASIIAAPLFHVTTNNCGAQVQTFLGGKLVHMYKWDAGEALRIVEAEKITSFSSVPIMTREMIAHPDYAKRDTSSLQMFGGGGAPVQPDLVDKVAKKGRNASPAQGYGLTETSGIVAASFGIFLEDKPGAAGRFVPVFDVRAVDTEGNPLPAGEVGEICIRGPQVIKGYLNRPDATAETIVDGWLHTGDIGYVDEDNFIFLVDRAKDMVLRGGENVYCSEVEVALFKFPGVKECAVFSVPDDRLGEEVGAAIVPEEGATFTAAEVRAFCKDHLAAYKIPRYIWITDTPLPRNATGKFLKRELQSTLDVDDAE